MKSLLGSSDIGGNERRRPRMVERHEIAVALDATAKEAVAASMGSPSSQHLPELLPKIVARDQQMRTDLASGGEAAVPGEENPILLECPVNQLARLPLAHVGGVVAQDAKPASQ